MRVVGLCEMFKFVLRKPVSEDLAKIIEHHLPAIRNEVVERFPEPRDFQRLEPRDGVGEFSLRRWIQIGAHAVNQAAARNNKATFMPPKPRQMINATSLRGVCGLAETGNGASSGSSAVKVGMPGTTFSC